MHHHGNSYLPHCLACLIGSERLPFMQRHRARDPATQNCLETCDGLGEIVKLGRDDTYSHRES